MSRNRVCDFLADPDSRSFSRFGAIIMQFAVDGRPFDGHHLSFLSRQAWDKHERKFGRKEALSARRFIGTDADTGGDWSKSYGADGYYMWSLHAASLDVQELPPTVLGIHVNTPYTGVKASAAAPNFANCSADRRALLPPPAAADGDGDKASVFTSAAARNTGDDVSDAGDDDVDVSADCRALGARLGGTTATIDVNGTCSGQY